MTPFTGEIGVETSLMGHLSLRSVVNDTYTIKPALA